MRIKTNELKKYLEVFDTRTSSGYFLNVSKDNTRIDIRGNDISGFIDIYYKDIMVVKMCLDNFPLGSYTRILYEPCDNIVEEINQTILIAKDKCLSYLSEYYEEQEKNKKHAKQILGCK